MTLGLELKIAREKAWLTLEKAAKIMGTSTGNYASIEKGLARKLDKDNKNIFMPGKRRFSESMQKKIKQTIKKFEFLAKENQKLNNLIAKKSAKINEKVKKI